MSGPAPSMPQIARLLAEAYPTVSRPLHCDKLPVVLMALLQLQHVAIPAGCQVVRLQLPA